MGLWTEMRRCDHVDPLMYKAAYSRVSADCESTSNAELLELASEVKVPAPE